MTNTTHTDMLLVGAGPANIALAVAMEELGPPPGVASAVMLEANTTVGWHPGMMFAEAQTQVSFLKDLATLRNPTSAFTFLNFLHETGRLDDFVNLQTFFPYRREISAYLRWCAGQLKTVQVHHGAAAQTLHAELDGAGQVRHWRVQCADGRRYQARRVVYGAGRQAHVPEPYASVQTPRIVHASRFLEHIDQLDAASIRNVAVVGGAQSSAEVFNECAQRFPKARVRLLMRSAGLKPYGGSRFTNEMFGVDFVDRFYDAGEGERQRILATMHDSNYAGVTPVMLDLLFRQQYLQRMDHSERTSIHTQCRVDGAEWRDDRVWLHWTEGLEQLEHSVGFDLVVLGTGYRNETPALLRQALEPLSAQPPKVDRHYRVVVPSAPGVSLHSLGVNEATHGISDTLLSVVGERASKVLANMAREPALDSGTRGSGAAPPPTQQRSPAVEAV